MERLLCLGDSITAADRLFSADRLGEGYVSMLPPLLKNYEILNKGMDGLTIARMLQNIQRDCLDLHPDIITIQVGINNIGLMMDTDRSPTQQAQMMAGYIEEYTALLKKITEQSHARLILIGPFIFPYPREFARWIPHVKTLAGHIKGSADTFGCRFLALHDLLGQEARRLGYDAVTTDGIHLTRLGHQIVAQRLYRAIDDL